MLETTGAGRGAEAERMVGAAAGEAPSGVTISASDPDVIVRILGSLSDHVVTLMLVDGQKPVEVFLDAVVTDSGRATILYRTIGHQCIPHGPRRSVGLGEVVAVHVW